MSALRKVIKHYQQKDTIGETIQQEINAEK